MLRNEPTYLIQLIWDDGECEVVTETDTFTAAQKAYVRRFGLGNYPPIKIAEANVLKELSNGSRT